MNATVASSVPASRGLARPARPTVAAVGAGLLLIFLVVAILAPLLAPYTPNAYTGAPLEQPSRAHLLGTNDVGQDILSEVIFGSRISLTVALVSGGVCLFLALAVGVTAGYLGGWADTLLMQLVNVVLALPHLPLMIVLAAFLGPGLRNIIVVISLLAWAGPARVIRSQVLSLRGRAHVRAAELLGAGRLYTMRRHLLPAIAPIAASALTALAGRAVMMEAGLAFLGIGDPAAESWGTMIHFALSSSGIYLTPNWLWWVLPPGACITLLVVSFAFLGTAVEERANARLVRHRA